MDSTNLEHEITVTIRVQSAFIDRMQKLLVSSDIPKEKYAAQISGVLAKLVSEDFHLYSSGMLKELFKKELETRKRIAITTAKDEINRLLTEMMKPELEAMEHALKITTAKNRRRLQEVIKTAAREARC